MKIYEPRTTRTARTRRNRPYKLFAVFAYFAVKNTRDTPFFILFNAGETPRRIRHPEGGRFSPKPIRAYKGHSLFLTRKGKVRSLPYPLRKEPPWNRKRKAESERASSFSVAPTTVTEQTRTPEAGNEALSCLTEGYPCVSVFSPPLKRPLEKHLSRHCWRKWVL